MLSNNIGCVENEAVLHRVRKEVTFSYNKTKEDWPYSSHLA
jgi:hypothetical protein